MQSRMDRYDSIEKKKYERSRKNTKLYEEIYDDMYKDISYKNMEIIDSAKEININKLKDILDDKYDTRQYRTFKNYDVEDEVEEEKQEKRKIYDINEIINDAKSKRAFIEEAKEKQKYLDFTASSREDVDDLKQEEKELEDLINTVTIKESETSSALDLLSELKGDDNTLVTNGVSPENIIEEAKQEDTKEETHQNIEKTLVKADKTFYTDSNMFTKNDFEDFSTLQGKVVKQKRKSGFLIIILILILLIIGYFVYTRYIMK